jgi:hypothetical protein
VGPVERFSNSRKLVSYWGLNPRENSSGGRQRLGSISPDISRRNCKMLSLSGISIFERKTSAEEGGQPFAYTV